ncbi:hypothetical protein K3495_g9142 [Podosphaera aphanis]|nr:hypothetical protein K3495_g9142 [Podosphaera aphanis]
MDCSWLKDLDTRRPTQSPTWYENKKGAFNGERIRLGLGIDQSHYAKLIEYAKYLARQQISNCPKQGRREVRLQMRKELEPILQNLPPAWVAKCIDQLSLITMSKIPKSPRPRHRPRADRNERSRRSVSMREPQLNHNTLYPLNQAPIESQHDAPGYSRQTSNNTSRNQQGYQLAEDIRPRTVTVKREFEPQDYIMHRPYKEHKFSREPSEINAQNFSYERYNQDTSLKSSKFQLNNWTIRSDNSTSLNTADTSSFNDKRLQDQGKLQKDIMKEVGGLTTLNTGNRHCNGNIPTDKISSHPSVVTQSASKSFNTSQHSEVSQPSVATQPFKSQQPQSFQITKSAPPQSYQVSQALMVEEKPAISQQSETSHTPVIIDTSLPPRPPAPLQPIAALTSESQRRENLQLHAAYQTSIAPQLAKNSQPLATLENSASSRMTETSQPQIDIHNTTPSHKLANSKLTLTSDKSAPSPKTETLQLPATSEISAPAQLIEAPNSLVPSKKSTSLQSSVESRRSGSREISINETAFMARRGAGDWVLLGTGSDLTRDSDTPQWDIFVSRLVAGLDYSPETDRIFCPWLSYTNGEELVEVFDVFGWRAGLGNMLRRNLCEFRFEVKEQSNPPVVGQSQPTRSSSLSTLDSYNGQ